jgi:hypothetical protein
MRRDLLFSYVHLDPFAHFYFKKFDTKSRVKDQTQNSAAPTPLSPLIAPCTAEGIAVGCSVASPETALRGLGECDCRSDALQVSGRASASVMCADGVVEPCPRTGRPQMRLSCVTACVITVPSPPDSDHLAQCYPGTPKRQRTRANPAWSLPFCVASYRLLSNRIHSPYEMA